MHPANRARRQRRIGGFHPPYSHMPFSALKNLAAHPKSFAGELVRSIGFASVVQVVSGLAIQISIAS